MVFPQGKKNPARSLGGRDMMFREIPSLPPIHHIINKNLTQVELLEVHWPRGCTGNSQMFEMKEEDALTDSD